MSRNVRRLIWVRPGGRQPRGKTKVSLVNSHTNATSKRQYLWEIDLGFAPGLTPGWHNPRVLIVCAAWTGVSGQDVQECLQTHLSVGIWYRELTAKAEWLPESQ